MIPMENLVNLLYGKKSTKLNLIINFNHIDNLFREVYDFAFVEEDDHYFMDYYIRRGYMIIGKNECDIIFLRKKDGNAKEQVKIIQKVVKLCIEQLEVVLNSAQYNFIQLKELEDAIS